MKCPKCGKKISKTWLSKTKSCPNCGAKLVETGKGKLVATVPSPKKSKPTAAWYLAPIFLGILGGILGYMGVKDQDKKMANKLLVLGILMTAIGGTIGAIVLYHHLL